jgi:hypothetical protein
MLYRHCLFNCALAYTIRRVQVNQDGLKINGTHQLVVYVDDISILGGSVHTVKENAVAMVVASKETGLEVNVDKTQYMVTFRDQNAGRSHSVKTDNSSFERLEKLKYFVAILTDQNCIQEEINSGLKSGNVCCRSVQNILYSGLLSKSLNIKI